MSITMIDQARIQAQLFVPMVRKLRAELGKERADTIAREALADIYRQFGAQWWNAHPGDNLSEKIIPLNEMFKEGSALEWTTTIQTADAYEYDVTACKYAVLFKELGEPDIGFLMCCAQDHALVEGFGMDVEFTRTQTIMQGASLCDFHFRLKKDRTANR
jgi:predicted ArsR family transcriptional regulator